MHEPIRPKLENHLVKILTNLEYGPLSDMPYTYAEHSEDGLLWLSQGDEYGLETTIDVRQLTTEVLSFLITNITHKDTSKELYKLALITRGKADYAASELNDIPGSDKLYDLAEDLRYASEVISPIGKVWE